MNNSAQLLLTTVKKKDNLLLHSYEAIEVRPVTLSTPYGKIKLTTAEQRRIDNDAFEIFAITEEHYPDPNKAIKEASEYNLRISILEIAAQIGCIDAATDFLSDYSNGLAQLKSYHSALAQIYYSQSKQVA